MTSPALNAHVHSLFMNNLCPGRIYNLFLFPSSRFRSMLFGYFPQSFDFKLTMKVFTSFQSRERVSLSITIVIEVSGTERMCREGIKLPQNFEMAAIERLRSVWCGEILFSRFLIETCGWSVMRIENKFHWQNPNENFFIDGAYWKSI